MTRTLAEREELSLLRDLFGELSDCKRIRSAGRSGSMATRGFAEAWSALCAGQAHDLVAKASVAGALVAARLGDLDRDLLSRLGVPSTEIFAIRRRAFDTVAADIDPALRRSLADALETTLDRGLVPDFVEALATQPRAGATCPGRPRLLLEPPESHADHCWAVAVFGVLLAPRYGADPTRVFLAGLAHHLHNASMPDAGFTGEMLLGEHLASICEAARRQALDQLPVALRDEIVGALTVVDDADTPEGRAFHAADVVDRVLQLAQHLRVAQVTLPMILDEWHLVHDGPVKPFHDVVLAEFGFA